MTAAKVLAGLGVLIMSAALVYGFGLGGGWEEVRTLLAYPWFNVSLVDVYVGFGLVCGWIVYREGNVAVAGTWVVAVLLLGNLVSCGYVLLALIRSRGDWSRFWLGARRPGP